MKIQKYVLISLLLINSLFIYGENMNSKNDVLSIKNNAQIGTQVYKILDIKNITDVKNLESLCKYTIINAERTLDINIGERTIYHLQSSFDTTLIERIQKSKLDLLYIKCQNVSVSEMIQHKVTFSVNENLKFLINNIDFDHNQNLRVSVKIIGNIHDMTNISNFKLIHKGSSNIFFNLTKEGSDFNFRMNLKESTLTTMNDFINITISDYYLNFYLLLVNENMKIEPLLEEHKYLKVVLDHSYKKTNSLFQYNNELYILK